MVIDKLLIGTLMIALMLILTIVSMYRILFSNYHGPNEIIYGTIEYRAADAFMSYLIVIMILLVAGLCTVGR